MRGAQRWGWRRGRAPSTALPAFLVIIAFIVVLEPPSANAQTYTILHTFQGADGASPAGLVIGPAHNFYGTTCNGGAFGFGVVFKLSKRSHAQTVLYNFTGGADGRCPFAGLIRNPEGAFYGTTIEGGDLLCNAPYGCGTVFKVDETGNETVLHRFNGENGMNPRAALTRARGSLYGTTSSGGHFRGGTVFKLNASGQATVLYSFIGGVDGLDPEAGLLHGTAGALYGTTFHAGASGGGTLFKLDMKDRWELLYSFGQPLDAAFPGADLIQDEPDSLYGTTLFGGAYGYGTVFQFNLTTRVETVLYNFTGGQDGAEPRAPLIRDHAGNLYGTTFSGGDLTCDPAGCGTVFMLDPSGNHTVLHSFQGGADGAYPQAGLVRDSSGNVYGTTISGGDTNCRSFSTGCGVVFKIEPQPHARDHPSHGPMRDHAGSS